MSLNRKKYSGAVTVKRDPHKIWNTSPVGKQKPIGGKTLSKAFIVSTMIFFILGTGVLFGLRIGLFNRFAAVRYENGRDDYSAYHEYPPDDVMFDDAPSNTSAPEITHGTLTGTTSAGTSWTYTGDLQNNTIHGRGRVDFESGAWYEGDWVNGRQHGQGTYEWSDGSRYVGGWRDNQRMGAGTLTRPNHSVYIGQWASNARHGQGIETFENGDRLEGYWVEGRWSDGRGRYSYSDGVYEGNFHNGAKHGQGIFTWYDGTVYEGDWFGDNRHGQGTLTGADGAVISSGLWSEDSFADVQVVFNNSPLTFTRPRVERNGYIFVPLNDLLNAFCGGYDWNPVTRTMSGRLNGNIVAVPLDYLNYYVNGSILNISQGLIPFIENETVYVYIDYIVEGLGLQMRWELSTRTFFVNSR